MATMMNSVFCQKQQKEHACKQRVVVMPLRMSEKGWEPYWVSSC